MASGHASAGAANGARGAPYAHFDDIKRPIIEVTKETPVDKILQYANDCMKQADFQKTYGRLDRALQEYIKASTVLIEILPSNSAWLSKSYTHSATKDRYNEMLARLYTEDAEYLKIKQIIREDNQRTGVKAKTNGSAPSTKNGKTNGTVNSMANGHRSTKSQGFIKATSLNDMPAAPRTIPGPAPAPAPAPAGSKAKPAIQPKPQALHGNALKSGAGPGAPKPTADLLAERFANLRPGGLRRGGGGTLTETQQQPQPVQDPRIRTQPINHLGFQQLQLQTQFTPPPQQIQTQNQQQIYQQFQNFQTPPKSYESLPGAVPLASSNTPMMHTLPDLPKVPDAIYSPARGSVSSPAAQLPTSASRGKFSRTDSVNSFSGATKTTPQLPSEDYFPAFNLSHSRQSSRPSQDSTRARKPRIPIPEGDTITAQELFRLIQAGTKEVQLLLVDIRGRSEFDDGHIMSQSTICVDSDTLSREDISGDQIAESMVLAPTVESQLFDRRAEADVIVFYDEDSEYIPSKSNAVTTTEKNVVAFFNALAYYDYNSLSDSDENKRPKLLRGGIEAWISLMGYHSLITSSTAGGSGNSRARRPAAITQRPRRATFTRPQSKYITRPIQDADELKRWEENLKNMESSDFVRTTDDFLRRYPPPSAIQESMTSPGSEKAELASIESQSPRPGHSIPIPPLSSSAPARNTLTKLPPSAASTASLYNSLPVPPTRPPPTVPRQTHNDVEHDDDDHYMRTKIAKAGVAGSGRMRRHKVGLNNPGNWCYGNSSFQSLFASGTFAEELTTKEWLNNWKVPMKADEKINHPQLLAKILGDSFYWMQFGRFETMKPKTLMEYCYHIHQRDFDGSLKTDRSMIFGGPSQQDAQEFISFLLENLHDETNRLRNRTGEVQQPGLDRRSTALSNGLLYWNEYRKYNDSLVDKYWRGVEVTDRRCRGCGHPSLTYEHFDTLHLPIPPNAASTATTMSELLAQYCGADLLSDYKCDECRRINTTEKRVRLVRMPDLLCISFRRFQGNEHYGFQKNNTAVVFPINGLDMTPYTVQARTTPADQEADGVYPDGRTEHQFRGPFLYDCYAVIVHSGTLRSGHYRSFIKDEGATDTSQWHHFDDSRIEPVIIGSNDSRDMAKRLYRDNNHGGASAYMVFYKRRV